MSDQDFYGDRKYCPACDDYVSYLASIDTSYCIDCGAEVRLFSKEDWERFQSGLETRPRPRRRKKSEEVQVDVTLEDDEQGREAA